MDFSDLPDFHLQPPAASGACDSRQRDFEIVMAVGREEGDFLF